MSGTEDGDAGTRCGGLAGDAQPSHTRRPERHTAPRMHPTLSAGSDWVRGPDTEFVANRRFATTARWLVSCARSSSCAQVTSTI
eukprot:575950-Rhodomonas_salina.1